MSACGRPRRGLVHRLGRGGALGGSHLTSPRCLARMRLAVELSIEVFMGTCLAESRDPL
jgi:hypothetical protein